MMTRISLMTKSEGIRDFLLATAPRVTNDRRPVLVEEVGEDMSIVRKLHSPRTT